MRLKYRYTREWLATHSNGRHIWIRRVHGDPRYEWRVTTPTGSEIQNGTALTLKKAVENAEYRAERP